MLNRRKVVDSDSLTSFSLFRLHVNRSFKDELHALPDSDRCLTASSSRPIHHKDKDVCVIIHLLLRGSAAQFGRAGGHRSSKSKLLKENPEIYKCVSLSTGGSSHRSHLEDTKFPSVCEQQLSECFVCLPLYVLVESFKSAEYIFLLCYDVR